MNIIKQICILFFLIGIVKSSKEIYDEAYEQAENYFQLGIDTAQSFYAPIDSGPGVSKQNEKAINYFEQSIQANPFKNSLKINAYLYKGYFLLANWNFSQGIEALNKGIELDPGIISYYLYYYKIYGLYKVFKPYNRV